jgi:hypothetical protein
MLSQLMAITAGLLLLTATGCKDKIDTPAPPPERLSTGAPPHPVEALSPAAPKPGTMKTMPSVVLTGLKILGGPQSDLTSIDIKASGNFLYNVVLKDSPGRLIVVLHKTARGKAPEKIEVNNGTVNRVAIAELDTGKGPAVKITIGLDRKIRYQAIPSNGSLLLNIPEGT